MCALFALVVTRSVKVAVLHACATYPRAWAAFGHRPPYQPPLQPNRAGGVLTEQGTLADVAAKHRCALVTRLIGDDALGDPGRSSRGRKTGPQRVTGYLAGVKPGSGGVALQYERHRITSATRSVSPLVDFRQYMP